MKTRLLFVAFLISAFSSMGQTTYLPLNTDEYHLLDRLETMSGQLSEDFFSFAKPVSRKAMVAFLHQQKMPAFFDKRNFTSIDQFNVERAISISGEWEMTAQGEDATIDSKRPILKYFYRKQPNMIHVSEDDFFLVVNPVLYTQAIRERKVDEFKYINTRGAELRGRILNKVGFYTFLADNQEKVVSYVRSWESAHSAFPGMDYYRNTSENGYDIFMARGYVDAGFLNDHVNVTFGYDKQFIGDGIRSLVLSDFSAPSTFLRLRTQYGRFFYENLFTELTPNYLRGTDQRLPHKYMSFHQLSFNATPWLNVGIFESTMYNTADQFKAQYLIPVLFYNTLARSLGADQKTSLGFNFKAITWRTFQWYGQFFIDRLNLSKGNWGNQFAAQLGGKYINAFTIPNLDLQGEVNIVRPFMYASNSDITSQTHYNQPLGYTNGAGIAEFLGMARYQPIPKLTLMSKTSFALRGTDSIGSVNYGNDIFKLYDSRQGDDGYNLTAGKEVMNWYFNFNAAYELRPNLYFEIGANHMRGMNTDWIRFQSSTSFYGGIRLNIARREFDMY